MTYQVKKICSLLGGAMVLALASCAHTQPDFDREKAAKAIADSRTFKNCWDACNWNIYTGKWKFIADRWGSALHLQPESLKVNPVGYWLYKEKGYLELSSSPEELTLSEKGKSASRDWGRVGALPERAADRTHDPFEQWEVPLATKKFVAITSVLQGPGMGVHFTEVHYTWVYALTPLGVELFKNKRIPSDGRNIEGWIAPAELTGIDLNKTYEGKATFILDKNGWLLQEDCGGYIC